MDDLERQLSEALKRVEPPDWFEAKVLAATKRDARPSWFTGWLRWASAMAAVVVLVVGVTWQRERVERQRGEAAKAQLAMALKITSVKLQQISEKVQSVQENQ
jgi:hypothetical protein